MKKNLVLSVAFILPIACYAMEVPEETEANTQEGITWQHVPNEIQEHILSFALTDKDAMDTLREFCSLRQVSSNFKAHMTSHHLLKPFVKKLIASNKAKAEKLFIKACMLKDQGLGRACIESGIDPRTVGPAMTMALSIAAKHGNEDLVNLLVEKGGLNAYECFKALLKASRYNQAEVIEALLPLVFADNDQDALLDYDRDLLLALFRNNTTKAREILEEFSNANACMKNNEITALRLAAGHGDIDMVEALLDKGAQLNAKSDKDFAALDTACSEGHLAVVRLLLKKGADMDVIDGYGFTTLMTTCQAGRLEVARLLIKKKADVNNEGPGGWTALMSAAKSGHLEIVNLLIEKGAKVNASTHDSGWVALMSAAKNGHLEVVRLLIEKGADVNAQDNSGWTALMSAAKSGHLKIVSLLIEKGADVNAQDNRGWTALMSAVKSGDLKIVRLLLEKKADVNAKNNNGRTALMKASKKGSFSIILCLIENGANIWACDSDGNNALVYAVNNKHEKIAQYLQLKLDVSN